MKHLLLLALSHLLSGGLGAYLMKRFGAVVSAELAKVRSKL